MLRHIQIDGYKSLRSVDVGLRELNVVFGPNAAGKSNFIESLMLLSNLATARTLADAFDESLRGLPLEAFSLPSGGLEGLFKQESARLSLAARIRPTNGRHDLDYRVRVAVTPDTGKLRLVDEYLARVSRKSGKPYSQMPPRIEQEAGRLRIRRLGETGQPRLEPVGGNHTFVSDPHYTGTKYSDFDTVRSELSSWNTYYLDPRHAMRASQSPREVTNIGLSGESLASFLYRLKKGPEYAGAFEAVGRAIQAAIPSVEGIDVGLDERRGTLDVQVTQYGIRFSSRVVSEGTLRVLSLCALAANPWPTELIAFEEPENGVQPRRIEVIADLLEGIALRKRTQVIVTTHSPTFVASILQKARFDPDRIGLLICKSIDGATCLEQFDPPAELFADSQIREALLSKDDASIVEAMLRRGWFDG